MEKNKINIACVQETKIKKNLDFWTHNGYRILSTAATSEKNGSPDCSKPHEIQRTRAVSVLIVDDEPINLELFDVMLSNLGFHVEMAADGEEALDRVPNPGGVRPGPNSRTIHRAFGRRAH